MAGTTPLVEQIWDRMKTVINTVTGTSVWWDLSDPSKVIQGYGAFPPQTLPAVYLPPPRCAPQHGITLGSYHRFWTFPILAMFPAQAATSEARGRAAMRGGHDILQALEQDRSATPSFGGLTVHDMIANSVEVDDPELLGASGFGVFYAEVTIDYTVAPEDGGI